MRISLVPTWLIEFEKEAGYTMNLKDWLKYGAYKKLWSLIGKRPWTYIWRDIYHQAEFVIFALWFFIGVGVYVWIGWFGVLLYWIFFTYGYISGHFHWGTKYIEGQKGK